jgi:hypothetical protein
MSRSRRRSTASARTERRLVLAAVLLAVVALAAAACGSDDEGIPDFSARELATDPGEDWVTNGDPRSTSGSRRPRGSRRRTSAG